jgi:hypothetical protein
VTGRVSDAEKDELVLLFGLCKGLLSPRIPIDGIAGVLQEVRGFFSGQAVGFPGPVDLIGSHRRDKPETEEKD